ncbi:hypothetical protein KY290_029718 [Solanum tuberosum]|uniref:Uncharacterized protein n=1 Tax=Solanum tuberosum TaxID=4113 RepID=A0ABQ7UNI1_SOLTU|nr:hypothetical protein KY290_029718 [Solanum tuberosum]
MKFSDMKLQAMNAVRAYFVRNWTSEDLMNTGEMTQHAYASLKRFAGEDAFSLLLPSISYSLLCHVELYFWILLALDMGSGRAVHNPFFCSKFTLSLLYITIESESIPCLLYRLVCRLLAPPTLGIGIIWFGSTFTRERSAI